MSKAEVKTTEAPPAAHVFSQGVLSGGLLQVSGQGPVDPATGEYVHQGDVGKQTTQVLRNIDAILRAGGATFADVIMLRVYLTKRDDFAAMNEAYGAFVTEHTGEGVLPSRTTVMVELPRDDMLVEIDALAVPDRG